MSSCGPFDKVLGNADFLGGEQQHATMVPRGRVRGRVLVPRAHGRRQAAAPDRLDAYTVERPPTSSRRSKRRASTSPAASRPPKASGADDPDAHQRGQVRADGGKIKLTRVKGGKTVKQFAASQAANGFKVWRSYDEPGGFRDQMYEIARKYPRRHQARQDRHDLKGREILALKVTQGARGQNDAPAGRALQRHPARPRVDRAETTAA